MRISDWSSDVCSSDLLPMSRAHNVAAGPAALPEPVLRQAQAELLEWGDPRASLAEISHRSPEFMQVAAEDEADLRRLLSFPDGSAVLFMPAGASPQHATLRHTIGSGSLREEERR